MEKQSILSKDNTKFYLYYDYSYVKMSNAFGLGLEGNTKNDSVFLFGILGVFSHYEISINVMIIRSSMQIYS